MPYGRPTERLSTRIPIDTMPQLRQVAAEQKLPPSSLVQKVMMDYLSAQSAKSPDN